MSGQSQKTVRFEQMQAFARAHLSYDDDGEPLNAVQVRDSLRREFACTRDTAIAHVAKAVRARNGLPVKRWSTRKDDERIMMAKIPYPIEVRGRTKGIVLANGQFAPIREITFSPTGFVWRGQKISELNKGE